MEFEWDETKRETNLEKHGVDFLDARLIWRAELLDPAEIRIVGEEARPTALGVIGTDEIVIAVVYTIRQDRVRLISARRATRDERRRYQDRFRRGS